MRHTAGQNGQLTVTAATLLVHWSVGWIKPAHAAISKHSQIAAVVVAVAGHVSSTCRTSRLHRCQGDEGAVGNAGVRRVVRKMLQITRKQSTPAFCFLCSKFRRSHSRARGFSSRAPLSVGLT